MALAAGPRASHDLAMNIEWGMGGFAFLPVVFALLGAMFWVAIIIAVILGIRWLIRSEQRSRYEGSPPNGEDSVEILRQRYARGEIDDEEFERRRKTLGG
jgi:putative membrane protein